MLVIIIPSLLSCLGCHKHTGKHFTTKLISVGILRIFDTSVNGLTFSGLFISNAVTLNWQTELLDKTLISSWVKLAWILFSIMHLSVCHDREHIAFQENKIS